MAGKDEGNENLSSLSMLEKCFGTTLLRVCVRLGVREIIRFERKVWNCGCSRYTRGLNFPAKI